MTFRIKKIRDRMEELSIDLILSFKPENRRYISGFTGSTGYSLVLKDRAILATDFRYIEQASKQCTGFEIITIDKEYSIFRLLRDLKIKRIGIEDEYATYRFVSELKRNINNVEVIPLNGLLTKIRMIKDEEEIECIRRAAEITDIAFGHFLKTIRVGMTEKQLANEIEFFMKKLGADGPSFDFIIASGKRSSMPHGVASNKIIEKGDFVTIDMGCKYKGYCSDMTRTIVMGNASEKQKNIYDIILRAQELALVKIRPGITGFQLDKIARDYITSKGYGEQFGHSLGHGVGLEVHELPLLVQHSLGDVKLEPGMVVTNEPGIYIADFGGVRIEDLVLVTKDGYEVLSKSTKQLLEINN